MQATPVREVPRRVVAVVPPTSLPRERRPLTPTVRKVLSDKLRYVPSRYVIRHGLVQLLEDLEFSSLARCVLTTTVCVPAQQVKPTLPPQ